jgi:hypothetical protein
MKIFSFITLILLTASCGYDKSRNEDDIDVIDTKMADILNNTGPISPVDSLALCRVQRSILKAIETANTSLLQENSLEIVQFRKADPQSDNDAKSGSIFPTGEEINKLMHKFIILQDSIKVFQPVCIFQVKDSLEKKVIDRDKPADFSFLCVWSAYRNYHQYIFHYNKISGRFKLAKIDLLETDPKSLWTYQFNKDSLFFPLNTGSQRSFIMDCKLDSFVNYWYTRDLKKLNESAIYNGYGDDIIRFSWFRSFHPAISIKIQKQNGKITLVKKKQITDKAGDFQADSLTISLMEYENFLAGLQRKSGFKNMHCEEKDDPAAATDGSGFILETRFSNQFRFVNRTTDKFYIENICFPFLKIAKITVPADEIY